MTVHNPMFTYIATRDHRLMEEVNHWRAPRWVRLWMICATRGGDGWLWYAMGLIILLFGGPTATRLWLRPRASTFTGICLFVRLKRIFNRSRPLSIEPHCWATLLPPDSFRFLPATALLRSR